MDQENSILNLTVDQTPRETDFQVSEVALIYKSKIPQSKRPQVISSHHAFSIFQQSWDGDTIDFIEQFKVLYLNSANKALGIFQVSAGGLSGTVADPRIILTMALKLCATAMILCHNHPSGNLRPSCADESLTNKIKQAASFLDIRLQDHIIINSEGYLSFADEGLL